MQKFHHHRRWHAKLIRLLFHHITTHLHGQLAHLWHVIAAWDDLKSLTFSSIRSLFSDFLVQKIAHLNSFADVWDAFLGHVHDLWLYDNRTITTPTLRCLEKGLRAFSSADADIREQVVESCERVWESCDTMGKELTGVPDTPMLEKPHIPFTQDSLVAYVDILNHTRALMRSLEESEWPLESLTRLTSILKGNKNRVEMAHGRFHLEQIIQGVIRADHPSFVIVLCTSDICIHKCIVIFPVVFQFRSCPAAQNCLCVSLMKNIMNAMVYW